MKIFTTRTTRLKVQLPWIWDILELSCQDCKFICVRDSLIHVHCWISIYFIWLVVLVGNVLHLAPQIWTVCRMISCICINSTLRLYLKYVIIQIWHPCGVYTRNNFPERGLSLEGCHICFILPTKIQNT